LTVIPSTSISPLAKSVTALNSRRRSTSARTSAPALR
jgi:hypothetical protein